MDSVDLFESVPNFSEGRDSFVIDAIAGSAGAAHLLDVDPDPDHHRVVVTLLASRERLLEGLIASIATTADRVDLRDHIGLHPRVGATDVVPIVPMGTVTLDECHDLAHELGEQVWSELHIPVFFYGYGEESSLADIRAGRAQPDLGGPGLHPTAGAVCVGARRLLVAFNVLLPGASAAEARAIARSIRESGGGMRGVQALVFELPGGRIQLSMNLVRVDETPPAAVLEHLRRRGVEVGEQQVVGLCPAAAAGPFAAGRVLEARIGAAVARSGAGLARQEGGEELEALAAKLELEAAKLANLGVGQEDFLSGSERCAALPPVLQAAGLADDELTSMALLGARGLRDALDIATRSGYPERLAALERRLA